MGGSLVDIILFGLALFAAFLLGMGVRGTDGITPEEWAAAFAEEGYPEEN